MSGRHPVLSIFPESSKYKICISDSTHFFNKRAFIFFLGNSCWRWNLSETNTRCIFFCKTFPPQKLVHYRNHPLKSFRKVIAKFVPQFQQSIHLEIWTSIHNAGCAGSCGSREWRRETLILLLIISLMIMTGK